MFWIEGVPLVIGTLAAAGVGLAFYGASCWARSTRAPLSGQGVRWQAVVECAAIATMGDGPLGLTLQFRFNDQGLIESVRAEVRGRTVGKTVVMTPWVGCWWSCQERDDMRVLMSGELAWLAPEGRLPSWRSTIRSLRYEYAH